MQPKHNNVPLLIDHAAVGRKSLDNSTVAGRPKDQQFADIAFSQANMLIAIHQTLRDIRDLLLSRDE